MRTDNYNYVPELVCKMYLKCLFLQFTIMTIELGTIPEIISGNIIQIQNTK